MSKPQKTAADYMVIAVSPALIMALVGSLCFFLIEVFYRGKMMGAVCWVMFWFIIGIVLVSRIAIESSTDRAVVFGLGLSAATMIYMVGTQASYPIGVLLLAIVWFCAHKLVWDCTLIDEDQDSSGQGLLQKKSAPSLNLTPNPNPQKPGLRLGLGLGLRLGRKKSPPHSPGRWVIYFSLAALPLFGVGQMLLPGGDADSRRTGFMLLALYLAAALGLLVTTSFLGLRRYLRQRYLKMPPVIALAWLKFGIGVVILVLFGAMFLPRPGANEAWAALRYRVDYVLRRASEYASPVNPPGQGEGRPGSDAGGKQGEAPKPSDDQGSKQPSNEKKPGDKQSPSQPAPAPSAPAAPIGNIYNLLRTVFVIVVVLVIGGWVFRRRYLLLEMFRSIIAAIREFISKFLLLTPARKAAKPDGPVFNRAKPTSFAGYKNPFFAAKDHAWPPEQIIIYSYEAIQVWAAEQGTAPRPEETAREFCRRLAGHHPEFDSHLTQMARLYAHAAYGKKLPPESDLEPVRELWRRLPAAVQTVALS